MSVPGLHEVEPSSRRIRVVLGGAALGDATRATACMTMMRTAVLLFTRDLRVHDHPALAASTRDCDRVVPLFVLDERLLGASAKRAGFLRERLAELHAALGLVVAHGDPVEETARFRPDAVYLSEDVSAYARRRVARLAERFDVRLFPGNTIVPPGELAPVGKNHYRVFSPYWRVWRDRPLPAPVDSGRPLRSADAVPLSPHLHFGSISPAEVARGASDELLRRLCWRDFYAQLLAAAPELEWRDLHPGRRVWRDDPDALAAWTEGRTGYPFVDAAMRQLHAEGWIPNRQRLVAASVLVKHLGIDWRIGAAHFMKHLLDGDAASNSGNWQWVAGTGTDTRPNRTFNPTRQGRLHDPDGDYVRRWLPELASLPARQIHDPSSEQRQALGYVDPIRTDERVR
jgi:deoxyribodipyrimidine photolyase